MTMNRSTKLTVVKLLRSSDNHRNLPRVSRSRVSNIWSRLKTNYCPFERPQYQMEGQGAL